MSTRDRKVATDTRQPRPGYQVIIRALPPGFLNGLPREDQEEMAAVVGRPVVLNGYDGDGRAELQFTDSRGHIHFVYLNPTLIRPIG